MVGEKWHNCAIKSEAILLPWNLHRSQLIFEDEQRQAFRNPDSSLHVLTNGLGYTLELPPYDLTGKQVALVDAAGSLVNTADYLTGVWLPDGPTHCDGGNSECGSTSRRTTFSARGPDGRPPSQSNQSLCASGSCSIRLILSSSPFGLPSGRSV